MDSDKATKDFSLLSILRDTCIIFFWYGYFFVAIAFAMGRMNWFFYTISIDTFYFPLYRWFFPTKKLLSLPVEFKIFIKFVYFFSRFLSISIFSIVSVVCLKKVFAFYHSDFVYTRKNESLSNLALTVFKKALLPITVITISDVTIQYFDNYIRWWQMGKERVICSWLARFVGINISTSTLLLYSPFSKMLRLLDIWLFDIPFLLVFICYDMNISNYSDIIECFKRMTKGLFLAINGIIILKNLFIFLIQDPSYHLMYLSFQSTVPSRVLSVIIGGFTYIFTAVLYFKMRKYAFANGFAFNMNTTIKRSE